MGGEITKVVFRVDTTKFHRGTVYALFPEISSTWQGHCESYQHVGQHSAADYHGCIKTSRPATEDEYLSLFNELIRIGCNLRVIKKYIK